MLKKLEDLQQDTVKRATEIIGSELADCIRVEIALYTSENFNEDKMKELFFDEALKKGWKLCNDNEGDVVWCWNESASIPEGNGGVTFYLRW